MLCEPETKPRLKRRCNKTIPSNTLWLCVLEDRLPALEDAVDGWTASTTESMRKGFNLASAAELKRIRVSRGGEKDIKKKNKIKGMERLWWRGG